MLKCQVDSLPAKAMFEHVISKDYIYIYIYSVKRDDLLIKRNKKPALIIKFKIIIMWDNILQQLS